MNNFEKDQDFLDLLAAWHENKNLSPSRRKKLLRRLEQDDHLRLELAREIEMAGLTRAAQAGEPRWLELEEKLGVSNQKDSPDFESSVMDRLSKSDSWGINQIFSFPQFAWIGIAAALVLAFFYISNDQQYDNGVAQVIRLEGENNFHTQNQILKKGEEFTIEQGLVEMAFRETGVHLVGTGPLKMTVISNDRIFLNEGEIKLVVPPQGIGFVVDTLERKFVDLGTSFVVQANKEGSKVLVLEGEIAVGARYDNPSQLMGKGSMANFDRDGKMNLRSQRPSGVPEISVPPMIQTSSSLKGKIFGIVEGTEDIGIRKNLQKDKTISNLILPLVRSKFRNRDCLQSFMQGRPLRFTGIAGTYNHFPEHTSLVPYSRPHGWMAWYEGKIKAPEPGRYRFWGYADNNLLVALNGKPVFEGSRYDSHFRNDLEVFRNNHPSYPCLNARAGFARGKWFEVGKDSLQIDLLFGETSENLTSGILLIEKEGASYEKTYWGQPKWPLFLTEYPKVKQLAELEVLRIHMEESIQGSFSVQEKSVWQVVTGS